MTHIISRPRPGSGVAFPGGFVAGFAGGALLFGWIPRIGPGTEIPSIALVVPPSAPGQEIDLATPAAVPPAAERRVAPTTPAEGSDWISRTGYSGPLAAYQRLLGEPDPLPIPWMETARALERIGSTLHATESWWQVLRRDPEDTEALERLEALAPGEFARRLTRELERYGDSFYESTDLESVLDDLQVGPDGVPDAVALAQYLEDDWRPAGLHRRYVDGSAADAREVLDQLFFHQPDAKTIAAFVNRDRAAGMQILDRELASLEVVRPGWTVYRRLDAIEEIAEALARIGRRRDAIDVYEWLADNGRPPPGWLLRELDLGRVPD